ncbi:MAG: hypothetical protein H6539_05380 [Bacteroidales bacterium]|nr:hypothetical protein [Bacteroidales bacterium]
MKTNLSLLLIISGLMLFGCKTVTTPETSTSAEAVSAAPQAETYQLKKYPIKSGIVTYDTKIAGMTGKTIFYFDNYGSLELEEKFRGNELNEGTLCDGMNLYSINYKTKTAYKKSVCSRGFALKVDWNEISNADKQDKAKKLDNITLAGKDCESYSYTAAGVTSVFAGWNNICMMQNQDNQYGGTYIKAVGVEENAVIPAEKFTIPVDFTIK